MTKPTRAALLALLAGTLAAASAQAPPAAKQTKVVPKFQVLAETKLLMEGLAQANYRGLDTLLRQKPTDTATWTFARGQALLIAETGNLLLLRPPRDQGRDLWFRRAMQLRSAAAELARAAAARDYPSSQSAFLDVTSACNRCHQNFRVAVRVRPGESPPAGGSE